MILSIQSYQKMKIKSMIYQRIPEPQIYFKTNEKAAFEAKSGTNNVSAFCSIGIPQVFTSECGD